MHVRIDDGERRPTCKLQIYEPPRFFEAFLRGRGFTEAPDITARICGICPVAYQMSAVHAMEDACGVEVDRARSARCAGSSTAASGSRATRCTSTCSTRPTSSATTSAIELARDQPRVVEQALELKKTGNELMTVVGGREIHPINVRVGGFYRAPRARAAPRSSSRSSARARSRSRRSRWTAGLSTSPTSSSDYELVALRRPGRSTRSSAAAIVSNRGLDIAVSEYDEHFVEEHVARSNALHSRASSGGSYLCGPLARFALAFDRLSPLAREAAPRPASTPSERNPFRSIVVRAVELVYAADEALRLIAEYEEPDAAAIEVEPRAGVGYGVHRGAARHLYHRYELDADGTILDAKIVPPTSQNQRTIEEDLRGVVERSLDLAGRGARAPLRADDPQLRPLHLLRDALPEARGRAVLSVIGVGNPWRSDDAAGLARRAGAARVAAAGDEVLERGRRADAAARRVGGRGRASWVVDAVSLGRGAGTVHRLDARARSCRPSSSGPPRTTWASPRRSSSHARSGRLPARSSSSGSRARASIRATRSHRRSKQPSPGGAADRRGGGGMHEKALMDDLIRKIELDVAGRGRPARRRGFASGSAPSPTSRRSTSASTSTMRPAARSRPGAEVGCRAERRADRPGRQGVVLEEIELDLVEALRAPGLDPVVHPFEQAAAVCFAALLTFGVRPPPSQPETHCARIRRLDGPAAEAAGLGGHGRPWPSYRHGHRRAVG